MVAQGTGGVIVNGVSDADRVGMAGQAAYVAAKGGVIALTKSLAQEVARHVIRVNAGRRGRPAPACWTTTGTGLAPRPASTA